MNDFNTIYIFEPRYHDSKVLIDKRKVKETNIIEFTKGYYKGKRFIALGDMIRGTELGTNGRIPCYEVPMGKLEPITDNSDKVVSI